MAIDVHVYALLEGSREVEWWAAWESVLLYLIIAGSIARAASRMSVRGQSSSHVRRRTGFVVARHDESAGARRDFYRDDGGGSSSSPKAGGSHALRCSNVLTNHQSI